MPRILKVNDVPCRQQIIIIFIALKVVTSLASNCTSNPCMYGICIDDSISSYRCYCIDGYTGINCETNWNDCWPNPCLNGGTCNDAIASYNCTCLEGFVGASCEQKYSECMNYPCQNNGTCLDYNGLSCQCPEGFTGEFCEIDVFVCNNTICKNFGECVEGPGLSFTCHCQNGWIGKYCEEDVNECDVSPCENGGLCINMPGSYTCACLFGFTGKDCEKNVIPCEANPCRNNAVCLLEDDQPVCYCVPDYHGTFCELRYDDCESKSAYCYNGGTCIDGINNYTCSCTSQYAGDTCTIFIEPTSMEIPTYPITPITEKIVPSEISTIFYTIKDTTIITETDKCLTNSCITTINSEEPEEVTVANSPDKTVDTTKFTEIQEILTIESRTEYDQNMYTTIVQDYTTTPDRKTSFIPDLQNMNSKPLDETAFNIYTTKSMEEIYPVQNSKHTVFKTTTEIPYFNESVTQFSILDEITTIQTTLKDDHQFSTAIHVITSNRSTTNIASENPNYSDAFESVSIPIIDLTQPTKPTESITTSSVEKSSDTEVDETITRNSTSFSVTEGVNLNVTMASPVTIVPFITMTEDTDNRIITNLDWTTSDSVEKFSNLPMTVKPNVVDTVSKEPDFTTVTEFYKSTFGTDIKDEVIDDLTTTSYKVTYSCTKDQCANISLCLYNNTQCDCNYWNNCKKISSVQNAAFSGKSYIRQKFTIENGILNIIIRLKTKAKSGILIHILFDDERYALLYMETGQLKFQFSCGLQTMLFGELDSLINNGHNVDIEMRFRYIVEQISDKCSAQLLVNGTVAMSGEQVLQSHENIPEFARLHLGGIPVSFAYQFSQIVLGFIGCMSLLKVNGIKRDFMYDSVETVQIEECNSFLCLSNPCKNFGACEEVNGKINCKCFAGYSGETCERSICDDNPCQIGATCLISPGTNFICVCPLGTHGLFCEEDTTVVQPSFSAVSPGFSSYMAYGVSSPLKDNMELKLQIIPQTLDQISLIAYMGQSGSKHEITDHFSITFVRGYLMLTWDLGSGVRRIFTNSPLNVRANKAHTLKVGRRGRDSWLYVEGAGNITGRAAGTNTHLDVSPILFIGGHKSKYFENLPHDLPLHTGFIGCIYGIELRTDENVFPVTMSSPATGRGVGECHRNECSHHSCKNGAVCLNYGPTYSCICMKDWTGPDCSTSVNCTTSGSLCHKIKN